MPSITEWRNLERFVAQGIWNIYHQLASDDERRTFCQQIGIADKELRNSNANSVNYTLPRMGEAYALKYHLGRADNLYMALQHIHAQHSLPEKFQVLDVGSGTGGSTKATVIWVARNLPNALSNLEVYGIEPMEMMRTIANYFREPFLGYIEEENALEIGSLAKTIRHSMRADSLETLIELEADPRFDLIIFSYTFPVQNTDEQQETLAKIVKAMKFLKTGGVLLFLTPKQPQTKQEFIKLVSASLIDNGLASKIEAQIYGYNQSSSAAPTKKQTQIAQVRSQINKECSRLGVEEAFDEGERNGQPYYGFYGTLDAFRKN